jgi:hypothetical protein
LVYFLSGAPNVHCPSGPQQIRHAAAQAAGVQLEGQLDASVALTPVDVLPESTEVDRLAPDLCSLRVQISRLGRVMSEGKAVDDARLPGAVGSEEQRKRAQRDALRLAEGLEVREAKGG